MRPPFPSAAQAYAESIDSATASRHHPDARLTILPLPSLAALYPLDQDLHLHQHNHHHHHHHHTHNQQQQQQQQQYSFRQSGNLSSAVASSSSSASHGLLAAAASSFPRSHAQSIYSSQQQQQQQQHHQQQQPHQQQRPQPSYQSYDKHFQKSPALRPESPKSNKQEYLGTNMESLLDAIEVHPTLCASTGSISSASSCGSLSPSTSVASLPSAPSSPMASFATTAKEAETAATSSDDSHTKRTRASPSLARMSISSLVDNDESFHRQGLQPQPEDNSHRHHPLAMMARSTSPSATPNVTHKRKWSRLSTHTSDDSRSTKIQRSLLSNVHASPPPFSAAVITNSNNCSSSSSSSSSSNSSNGNHRPMTTISCYHASVAQKSYGSEKRFLCPPPIVQIQGHLDDSNSGLSSKPQVAMSVICDSGENSTLGQRSTLEEDQSSTFRYLYVSGTAKAKAFQLKLQIYGRPCLPNGFVSGETLPQTQAQTDEPYATFDSAPITIISKPSKKTAKARNVSSCILAGSLVSLFNRINSQTVRTKYMTVQEGGLCAKSSTWSPFTISIVSNGPCASASPRSASAKSHHRQPATPSSTPITYGAEIILTEVATGVQSDRLVVCKVENGRILEGAVGPICQMQKVALQSLDRNKDGQPLYLGAVGDDHQGGRFMDHSTASNTILRYEASTMTETSKAGGDDFLCWTIVGISKFEHSYFESANSENQVAKSQLATRPITPFPLLVNEPVYNSASHSLELCVSSFYSQLSNEQDDAEPMQVWLGSSGPLKTQIIRRNVIEGQCDETTLLADLPQGHHLESKSSTMTLPLLFVRPFDGVSYDSRVKVAYSCLGVDKDRWAVHLV